MIRFRQHEMAVQFDQFPHDQIGDLLTRMRVVPQRLFGDYVPWHFPFSAWVYGLLFTGGLVFLAVGWREWMTGKKGNEAAAALLMLPLPLVAGMLLIPWTGTGIICCRRCLPAWVVQSLLGN